MEYPSLLYFKSTDLPKIDISVFEDLQLLNFTKRRFTEAVLQPCDKENASCREEIFRMLEREDFKATLKELYENAKELCTLDSLLEKARCELEAAVIFSSLLSSLIDFAEKSAKIRDGELFKRFSSFFSDFLSSLPDGLKNELENLKKLFSDFEKTSFSKSGEELKLLSKESIPYISRLDKCKTKLGLDVDLSFKIDSKQLASSIIDGYKKLYKNQSEAFIGFYGRYKTLYDRAVTKYETELGFYLSFASFFEKIRSFNIPLVYPKRTDKYEINIKNAYDVSLIKKDERNIVPNDIEMTEKEPFFFLTGANGGGKTTYLRTVGIAVVLYLLGCQIPCDSAEIGGINRIFTHFPHDERFDGTGRFVEEKTRVDDILSKAEKGSVILLNETFSSTNEENAVKCTSELAREINRRGIFGLYITHQHAIEETEIPYLNVKIDTEDQNRRTYKVIRKRASDGSFALDILKKYSLTKEALEKRFKKESDGEGI